MDKKILVLVLFLNVNVLCVAQKINGVSYVASGDSIAKRDILPVLNVNANYVSLMPFGFMKGLHSSKIFFESDRQWFGEKDAGIRQYASILKSEGVKILLKPQIYAEGNYTGDITFESEEEWKQFESSYEYFILTYANTAKAIRADIFCIGTELQQFIVKRPLFWRGLIKKIKRIYKGKLIYAANWDEYKRLSIWDELDFIGIDAYFPLSDKKSPSVKDFQEGWVSHKKEIQTIQSQFQKPVIFTEFGYRSINFSGKEPWDSKWVEGEVNFGAQVNGLQAIYNEFWKEDWFMGGFIWKWFVDHERIGKRVKNRFSPQNKPAEKLLKKLYNMN